MVIKNIIYILIIMVGLSNAVLADTTFFDQDDAFIMGESISEKTTKDTTELKGASGGLTLKRETNKSSCFTNWTCTSWSFCNNEVQIRNCTKTKVYCYADFKKKPIESQNCFVNKNNTDYKIGITNYKNNIFNIKLIILGIFIVIGFIILYKKLNIIKQT